MTTLTPEERALGRHNANTALGVTRRDFLKAAAVAPVAGAFYYGYEGVDTPVRAAIIGTGNEGCGAMIAQSNRAYVDYIGFCDARPSNQKRAREEFKRHADYSEKDAERMRQYDDLDAMLDDKDVEMVVIALPLVAARAGGHQGDAGRQARLQREADGPLRRRVQGDVPNGPRHQSLAGRRPPAALLGAVQ